MHIGRCENCKYMDLVENVGGKCPRCGARMVSLGIESVRWNRMSKETRTAILLEMFPEDAGSEEEPGAPEALREDEGDKVYVCYSCSNFAEHDGSHDRYYCTECGSDMVYVGYPSVKWAELSPEDKRKAAEDAKIRHMVTEIKKAEIEDNAESTPNIINVV